MSKEPVSIHNTIYIKDVSHVNTLNIGNVGNEYRYELEIKKLTERNLKLERQLAENRLLLEMLMDPITKELSHLHKDFVSRLIRLMGFISKESFHFSSAKGVRGSAG